MEITPELANLFGSELNKVESVEITYQNGGKVIGTVKKVRKKPLKVVILKSQVEQGERPKHRVVFDHVTQMQFTFLDGSTKTFE
jgi:hypothetical protein